MIERHARALASCVVGSAAVLAVFTVAGTSQGDALHVASPVPTAVSPSRPIAVYALASCVNLSPNRTLTLGNLSKMEGTIPAWEGSLAAPVPANATAHVFYGLDDANCSRLWVTDFVVTPSMTATSATKFEPWFHVGDRRRNGQYSFGQWGAITEDKLLDTAELAACDASKHTYQKTPYPTSQKCQDAASKDICSRLLGRVITAWKKDGTSDFKIYNSAFYGYLWDGFSCARSPSFGYSMTPNTYDSTASGAADHFKTLPVPAGRKDVYRVVAGVFLYTKAITTQDGNALEHGTSTGDAMFLFNPNEYPPSMNPLVEQVPVEAVLQPE